MTSVSVRQQTFLIADPDAHTRTLVADVLRAQGMFSILQARDGRQMLELVCEHEPRVVITTSRLPNLSGLEFTRLVRTGFQNVPRELSIIVMTDTPTRGFIEAAQSSGVDEMLARPFSAKALLLRIQAVIWRPREFIDCAVYVGPCRRRRMIDSYSGPMRRFVDPAEGEDGAAPWENDTHRQAVRSCVKRISELSSGLSAGDRRKLRDIYAASRETAAMADETQDQILGAAARSLGRYIQAVGASGTPDPEVITTHIDAMHTLGMLSSRDHEEREKLVAGLKRVVDKKLGRLAA